ncbi:hypothetical protein V2J09_023284 [Rumex salicifolius]
MSPFDRTRSDVSVLWLRHSGFYRNKFLEPSRPNPLSSSKAPTVYTQRMKLKFPSNDIRINRISLPFTPITSGIASQFQCSSSAGIRIQINRNRNNLSSVHRRFSPLCSLSQSYNGQSVDQVQAPQRTLHDSFLQVVLVSPQIPGNVGSIARTCAASAVGLHLVEPLGFTVDNTKLKRAGLDYWPYPS